MRNCPISEHNVPPLPAPSTPAVTAAEAVFEMVLRPISDTCGQLLSFSSNVEVEWFETRDYLRRIGPAIDILSRLSLRIATCCQQIE